MCPRSVSVPQGTAASDDVNGPRSRGQTPARRTDARLEGTCLRLGRETAETQANASGRHPTPIDLPRRCHAPAPALAQRLRSLGAQAAMVAPTAHCCSHSLREFVSSAGRGVPTTAKDADVTVGRPAVVSPARRSHVPESRTCRRSENPLRRSVPGESPRGGATAPPPRTLNAIQGRSIGLHPVRNVRGILRNGSPRR